MKWKITLLLLVLSFTPVKITAQLTDLVGPNAHSEFEVYMDSDSLWYSTSITVKFKGRTIDLPAGVANAATSDIINPTTGNILLAVKQKYGDFRLEKVFTNSSWGDTLGVDRNTGRHVRLRDLSQFYRLIFDELICVDSLISELKTYPEIIAADRPVIIYPCYVPNDYSAAEQWSLEKIGATRAWDVTTGSSNVKIAIVDSFGVGNPTLHNELQGSKVDYNPDGLSREHGQLTAGAAAALTDNGSGGISSIGFNVELMLFGGTVFGFSDIVAAYQADADIINCSWLSHDYTELENAIYNALALGKIVVASAGNGLADMGTLPRVVYPAAYNFGDIGREVIAVSATMLENNEEVFAHDADGRWNYSPKDNPGVFPDEAFIDFSAPGVNIKVLHPTIQDEYIRVSGTSESAPIVAGTIALMKSVNPNLTPEAAFEILKNTAEKVGADSYNYQIDGGWNEYMGYGRINAHNAVNVAAGAPYPPTNLYVTTSSSVGIFTGTFSADAQLNWLSIPNINKYRIYKATTTTGSEPDYDDYVLIDSSSTNSANVTVSDFGDSKEIYYRITAVNTSGKESVLSESMYDWAPPSPPSINVTPSGGHPKISWTAVSGMTHRVYRKIAYDRRYHQMPIWSSLTLELSESFYTDGTIDWDGTHVANEVDVYYKVTKRRNTDLISNFSNTEKVWFEGEPPNKEGADNEEIPIVYAME